MTDQTGIVSGDDIEARADRVRYISSLGIGYLGEVVMPIIAGLGIFVGLTTFTDANANLLWAATLGSAMTATSALTAHSLMCTLVKSGAPCALHTTWQLTLRLREVVAR
jgi:hypothetical protein